MTPRKSSSTSKNLFATLVLRGTALAGRFVFVIFAAKYMLPADFGRFGLLAALALIIPAIAGLECYQVLLRRILQEPARAAETRQFYGTFILAGSLVSGVLGGLTLVAFRWTTSEICIGTAILILEYVGLESFRNLVNEHRPALSVLSVALRTGVWGVIIPMLFFFGLVPAPWTFETVLWFWMAGATAAVLVGIPLWGMFWPRKLDLRYAWVSLKEVIDLSWVWVLYNASFRLIETGGRFVCAWLLSEVAVGRFTFVSMLASLSYVAQKGVVEPVFYPRLSTSDVTESTQRQFRRINYAVIIGGTLCSILGLAASALLNGEVPPASEVASFALLCLAFAFLSLSQPAHFRLYRSHKDKVILMTGICACVTMAVASVAATLLWGIAGAAGGTMLGALVLFVLKVRAAKRLVAAPDGTRTSVAD